MGKENYFFRSNAEPVKIILIYEFVNLIQHLNVGFLWESKCDRRKKYPILIHRISGRKRIAW